MNKLAITTRIKRGSQSGQSVLVALMFIATLACTAFCTALGQTRPPATKSEARTQTQRAKPTTVDNAVDAEGESSERPGKTADAFFGPIYRNFYNTYRVGPSDVLALRVAQQPDYTVERAKVSPVGRVYHPLLGDVEVAGLTVGQILDRFSKDLGEYLLNPKVSVELVEANSAKIGVLGEVRAPGIVVMSQPMTVMDAVAAAGGFADTGSKSNVTLLRQEGGRLVETKINVKRMLEGKSSLDEDLTLRAGDTLVVRGNTRKKIAEVTSLIGFAQFVTFLTRY